MVTKNRCTKSNLQRMDREIKPDLMLFTQSKMLPILHSVPPKMSVRNYSVPIVKPKIIQLSKHENKPVLSFLQEPLCVFNNKDKKELKEHQLTYNKSKIQKQKYTIHNRSESLKTSPCDTLKKFYKSRRFIPKKKEMILPFPNTINLLNNDSLSHIKIDNYNHEPSNSILQLNNSVQQKQEVHEQLYAKLHSSAKKQISLCKNKNTLYGTNAFLPITGNIFQEKRQTNTNYANPITSNLDHNQNRDVTETTALTFLKTGTTNDTNSSIVPINQSIFCDVIPSKLDTKNNKKKKDGYITDKIHFSSSEQMVNIVNYGNKTLEMCHPKMYNLSCSIKEKTIKRSMSAIQYRRSAQCMFDIKNNISDPHIPLNKYDNQKNRPRLKVQYSLENTNCIPISEKSTYITSKSETKDNKQYIESGYSCRIKYSWQVIGTSSQTSKVLLYNFLEKNKSQVFNYANKPSMYKCDVKYSWQIIGTGTQVALQNSDNTDYWTGIICKPNIHQDGKVTISGKKKEIDNDIRLHKVQQCGKKLLILNNQYTQTFVEKETQSDCTDCKVKYSWQNLVWQHL